jgi:hypothetical protein
MPSAVRASSSRVATSKDILPHNATPNSTSKAEPNLPTYHSVDATLSGQASHNNIDLLEIAAWIHPDNGLQYHQDFSYTPHNNGQNPDCPYHTPMLDRLHGTTVSGYDLEPVGRWIDEKLEDGGALALQLWHQMRMECTCIVLPDDVGMDGMRVE